MDSRKHITRANLWQLLSAHFELHVRHVHDAEGVVQVVERILFVVAVCHRHYEGLDAGLERTHVQAHGINGWHHLWATILFSGSW